MACLGDDAVLAFVEGGLAAEALDQAERHVARCGRCRTLIAEAARFQAQGQAVTGPTRHKPAAAGLLSQRLAVGTRVSRYTVRRLIGSGGGGVVYEAYDPQLDRVIALKLLDAGDWEETRGRRLSEAYTMARLSHPNVVNVYDSDTYEGRVFIAMELVSGQTLTDWLGEQRRSWREIANMFLAAGQGLAAAHAAQVVHRDFKPDNVLVGADGRPRVSDFGLAHRLADDALDTFGQAQEAGTRPSASDPLTLAGAVSGTPGYMAPEQMAGEPAGKASDQFTFCVALYVALYRQHPFVERDFVDEDSLAEVSRAVRAGQVRPRPPGVRTPRALHRALLRGLRPEASARYPTMDALLRELRAATRAWWQKWPAAAVLVLACVAATALAANRRGAWTYACGNGTVEPGEECDDGNRSHSDSCLPTCAWSKCGDGKSRRGVEECDDGNSIDDDGCSNFCLACPTEAGRSLLDNGRCYTRHAAAAGWDSARAQCEREGGDLATYRKRTELRRVATALLRPGERAWIGLFRLPSGEIQSVDGMPLLPGWSGSSGPIGDCGYHEASEGGAARDGRSIWGIAPCGSTMPFLCERRPPFVRGTDRHAFQVVYRNATWHEARARCRAQGGDLAFLDDPAERSFVAQRVKRLSTSVWIGDAQGCAVLDRDSGRTRTEGCDRASPFICEFH